LALLLGCGDPEAPAACPMTSVLGPQLWTLGGPGQDAYAVDGPCTVVAAPPRLQLDCGDDDGPLVPQFPAGVDAELLPLGLGVHVRGGYGLGESSIEIRDTDGALLVAAWSGAFADSIALASDELELTLVDPLCRSSDACGVQERMRLHVAVGDREIVVDPGGQDRIDDEAGTGWTVELGYAITGCGGPDQLHAVVVREP
jgi:hypothetical protein